MNTQRADPGTVMAMQWRKWDGSAHWGGDVVYLGADRWGHWYGKPVGWEYTRPGASYVIEAPAVTMIPETRSDYAVSINRRHPRDLRVYIDLAWDLRWEFEGVTGIDMDLDVVRRLDERGTYVDDRDEWAQHSIRFGYPPAVMTHLEALALQLEEQVRAQVAPFDESTGDAWLDRLEALDLQSATPGAGHPHRR